MGALTVGQTLRLSTTGENGAVLPGNHAQLSPATDSADGFDRTGRRTGVLYPAIITSGHEDGACVTGSFSSVGVACLHGRRNDGPTDLAVDALRGVSGFQWPTDSVGVVWLDCGRTCRSATRTLSRTSDDDDRGADLCEVPGELGVEVCLALTPARAPGAKFGFGLVRRVVLDV